MTELFCPPDLSVRPFRPPPLIGARLAAATLPQIPFLTREPWSAPL